MVSTGIPHPSSSSLQRPILWSTFCVIFIWLVESGRFGYVNHRPSWFWRPPQATNVALAPLNSLKFSVWISRGAGLVLAFDGGLILIPMLRNIIRVVRPKLAWLFPADENIWFHRQVAYSMAFWAMVHTTAHYVNFINVERTRMSSYPCNGE